MTTFLGGFGGNLWVFVVLSGILGGTEAFVTGKAIAETWKPYWQLVWYMVLLASAVRFFHYALFQERLLSAPDFLATFTLLAVLAASGHRRARSRQMREQYGWRTRSP